jgi:hypothetical protein
VWGNLADAKVFNPNIAKLDTKTVSCHFIGYPDRSKGYRFYTLDRYTKFVETRHAVFLDDEMMRGSTVAQKIDLEEKRVHTPNLMIQEPCFSLPVVPALTIPKVAVQAPAVTPPVTTRCEDPEPIRQERTEPIVEHERELQQMCQKLRHTMSQRMRPLEGPNELRNQLFPLIYKVYNTETVHMEGDPTSYEEAMGSPNSSKWLEAMEDEMKSTSSNDVRALEEIPKGDKTVGCKWVYKTKYDSNENVEKY